MVCGCSKRPADVTSPPIASLPPQIVATSPVARSTNVIYDTEIWAQFDRSLDPTSVNGQTVFLKIDARRIPCTIGYEGVTRRVIVSPSVVLDLQRTYTVEFSTSVKGSDGLALPVAAFFQFTTNSLRRVVQEYPTQDALEGPLSALGWSGNGPPSDKFLYEVYASSDSVVVEQRSIPYARRSVFFNYLPSVGWGSGAIVYWTVTVENVATGERLLSPVFRFRTHADTDPIDSMSVAIQDWGGNGLDSRTVQYCNRTTIPSGPRFLSAVHWALADYPPHLRLAYVRAEFTLSDQSTGTISSAQPRLWLTQNDWLACGIVAPSVPFREPSGYLGTGIEAPLSHIVYQSDLLAAFFEAQGRHRSFVYGTALTSEVNLVYDMSVGATRAILYYYR